MPPLLRNVIDSDLPIFFEQQMDAEANRMAAVPARDRDAFFAHWAKILADPAVRIRCIVSEGRVAGNILAFDRAGEREVGYWLGRAFWGQGIASAALAAFLEIETARPLTALAAAHNIGSIRVLEKNGFTRIGVRFEFENPDDPLLEVVILRLP